MDQQLLAGIGNELSDEMLWRARLAPTHEVRTLSGDAIGRLHRSMETVLSRSMAHGRIPSRGPWLEAVREEDDPHCPRCGTPLRRSRVSGRTALWCPRCQS